MKPVELACDVVAQLFQIAAVFVNGRPAVCSGAVSTRVSAWFSHFGVFWCMFLARLDVLAGW